MEESEGEKTKRARGISSRDYCEDWIGLVLVYSNAQAWLVGDGGRAVPLKLEVTTGREREGWRGV